MRSNTTHSRINLPTEQLAFVNDYALKGGVQANFRRRILQNYVESFETSTTLQLCLHGFLDRFHCAISTSRQCVLVSPATPVMVFSVNFF